MLIGVNALYIKPGWGGGEERFLRRILNTMRAVQPDVQFIIFTDRDNDESFEGWDRECIEPKRLSLFSGAESMLAAAAKQRGIDLLFSPLRTAPTKLSVPLVVFSLDIRRFERETVREEKYGASNLRAAKAVCANAETIVVPSEFTRRKFLDLLEIPLNKLMVAPLGVGPEFDEPLPPFVEKPYLLAVGDTHAYKNVERLRQTFAQLKDEFPHNLVVVGRPAEAEPDEWGERVIRIDTCGNTHLASLYQHCDVYIQPSLYEGSGITVLEAMRSGCTVAASHTGGITEVAADVPLFMNSESVSSMVTIIRWALEETKEQRRRRTRYGRQMSIEYTWEKCAWKTLAAFKRK